MKKILLITILWLYAVCIAQAQITEYDPDVPPPPQKVQEDDIMVSPPPESRFYHKTPSKTTPFIIGYMKNGRYLLLDKKEKPISGTEYTRLSDFGTNMLIARTWEKYPKIGELQLLDTLGRVVKIWPYAWLEDLGDGRYIAKKDTLIRSVAREQLAIIDTSGKVLFPFKYGYFGWVKGNWAFAVDYINKVGGLLRLSDGHFIPKPDSVNIGMPNEHFLCLKAIYHKGNWQQGLVDTTLREVYPPIYNEVFQWQGPDGPMYAFANGRREYAFGDQYGKLLTDFTETRGTPVVIHRSFDDFTVSPPKAGVRDTLPYLMFLNTKTSSRKLYKIGSGWLFPPDSVDVHEVYERNRIAIKSMEYGRYVYEIIDTLGKRYTPKYHDMLLNPDRKVLASDGNGAFMLDIDGNVLKHFKGVRMPNSYYNAGKYYFLRNFDTAKYALSDKDFNLLSTFKYHELSEITEAQKAKYSQILSIYPIIAVGTFKDDTKVFVDKDGNEYPM